MPTSKAHCGKPIKHKVAVLFGKVSGYDNHLSGIAAYIREHDPWSVCIFTKGLYGLEKISFSEWRGQGIIICLNDKVVNRAVNRLKIPVVCIGEYKSYNPSWPRVKTDHAAVTRMAAEHLLERGFKQFGFCGHKSWYWSIARQEHFVRLIRARGFPCSVLNPERRAGAEDAETEDIGRWLAGLPKPLGIMASEDIYGRMVLDACRRRGILVPDEIAVIGVSEGDSVSELCDPPLSNVMLNACREGYEAAAMLDTLMSGKKLGQKVCLVGPIGIKTRQSTDILAIEDRNIASALRYIRENACKGINVRDVLKAVPQSRTILDRQFIKLIGRTPHDEIIRVRLNRVKLLLSESDLSQEQIAEQTGFEHVEYLSVAFCKNTGITPGHYRRLNRSRL